MWYISTKLNCAEQTDGNYMDMSGFHGENEGENRIHRKSSVEGPQTGKMYEPPVS